MNKFHSWILAENDPKAVIRRSTMWNLAASLLSAGMTALILFFLSWTSSAQMSGIFSIATAIAYQVQAIGMFGVRNYHIADVKDKYSFSDYVYVNVISSIVMAAVLAFMAFGRGYSLDKALVVLTYSLYRVLDIYEALFHDEYQRAGRIDIGLILQTVRCGISLVVLVVVLVASGSLVWAFLAAFVVSVVLIWYQNKDFARLFGCRMARFNRQRVKQLMGICLPICIASFLALYLTNASKYAIDNVADGDSLQGIFAVLFVPVFTINMLAMVVYRPYITLIATEWVTKKIPAFVKSVGKQILVILVLTLAIMAFGYVIGLKLLGIVYNSQLDGYMAEFCVLLLGGGLSTLAVFLNQIMIIVGCQNLNLIIYFIAVGVTFVSGTFFVAHMGIMGAALLYGLGSLVLVVLSFIVLFWRTKQVSERRG